MVLVKVCVICTVFLLIVNCGDGNGGQNASYAQEKPADNIAEFEKVIESIRAELRIPGLGAAITKNGEIVWAKGFGYADVENKIQAGPKTSFHLASLTKTFASTIIMQLVEQGKLDLNSPVSEYGIDIDSPGTLRVIHLLTHTSEGIPGTRYKYNGARFGELDRIIEKCSGKTFAELAIEQIIRPLKLTDTAPNTFQVSDFELTGYDIETFRRNFAVGYTSDGRDTQTYPRYFGTSAGMLASAVDMVKYSIAIDENKFLKPETKERAWTPMKSNSGETLPYGLGWFVQEIKGKKIVWHYGWWTGNSSLIIKIPDEKISFVLLANTDMLSRGYPQLGEGDITCSKAANAFLDAFVFGNANLSDKAIEIR